jgi:hypothetical protein
MKARHGLRRTNCACFSKTHSPSFIGIIDNRIDAFR